MPSVRDPYSYGGPGATPGPTVKVWMGEGAAFEHACVQRLFSYAFMPRIEPDTGFLRACSTKADRFEQEKGALLLTDDSFREPVLLSGEGTAARTLQIPPPVGTDHPSDVSHLKRRWIKKIENPEVEYQRTRVALRPFLSFRHIPPNFTLIHSAVTADGRMAAHPGHSRCITSEQAQRFNPSQVPPQGNTGREWITLHTIPSPVLLSAPRRKTSHSSHDGDGSPIPFPTNRIWLC
ncbi:hypothetical protein C772_00370 [Bhargavaea cecembensis DSE10]|uniref:Uncharacterized protein n=1 Tax=Bhargavaea cecembensis DSE10 TaxID=1235279 RepID=M7PA48_9BACL|nr:hypothetical protein C772_00370 [Bhargavaea cecembensis DSE10]